ncbi:nuclear pore membrane glycoprotein 210-like [Argiope bruennichi]|uniref:nuclear pore membrane glycoprotein 210-like n=1 Tax=Argiope bruennichi TaxID=94029 RepID=UPI0024949E81|nr:nuclear pore membrane glycoprotein 210-like [Argiope bruennichi]
MSQPASKIWCIYASLIIFISVKRILAVRLNAPRILLPYNRNGGLPSNYTLRILEDDANDCYEWSSADRHLVEVDPVSERLNDCSYAAIVSIVSSSTEKRITKVKAKGSTGIELECDVITDFPDKIELVSTTDELAVDSPPESLTIIAKDRFGHQFASINGLKFEWKVEQEVDKLIDSSNSSVVRLKPIPLTDGWAQRGLLGYSVLIEPLNIGSCKIQATTLKTESEELSTQEVKMHISSNVRVCPSTTLRLLPGGSVRLALIYNSRKELEYQRDFTVSKEDSKIVELVEEDGAVAITGSDDGEAYFTLKSNNVSFPSIDMHVAVVKPARLEIHISRGDYKVLEEHKSYLVSIELFDENGKVIYPSENLKIAVSFPTQLFYINSTTSNGTWYVIQALTPGKGVIRAELKGVYLKDGSMKKEYELQNSVTVTVCQKIQIFPPFILLPSDSLRHSSHEIRLLASGGTGHYHWTTNNELTATVKYDKEKSHVGYLEIKKEGDFTVIITDEENVNFIASAKVSVQPVIDVETYPTVVEAEIGNVLILPVAFLAYEDKERKIIRKFDDCSKVESEVEIIEKHVLSYDKEPHVPAFGKGCRTLQFRCKYPGHSRINVFYGSEIGNTTHKTTTVLSCFKNLKPIHPVRVAVMPLGASMEVAFDGGPRKWPLYKSGHYQKLEASNPELLDIQIVIDPIRYNKDLTVFRVLCKALGENTLTFLIGNEPSATNPHPAKAETSIKIVCNHPHSVHLKLTQKSSKKLKKDNLVKVPFYGEKLFSLDVWLKDSMGRKLYNISSLHIQWSLSDSSIAGDPDSKKSFTTHANAAAGYTRISRDFKELKMTGGTGKLTVTAKVIGYRKEFLEKLGTLETDELKEVSGYIDLDLVSLRDINEEMYNTNDRENQEEETCDGDSCKE